jgi:hypothetical protein
MAEPDARSAPKNLGPLDALNRLEVTWQESAQRKP